MAGSQLSAKVEYGLGGLALLTALGPLLGLLGTVVGIVLVFERLAGLRGLLEAVSASTSEPLRVDAQVLLEADERAEHGRVVEVMDLVHSVGLSRLSIEMTRAERYGP